MSTGIGILNRAAEAKQKVETASYKEKIDLILAEAQMNNHASNGDQTQNLEKAFKKEDKKATVTKSNAVYEVTFKEKNLLISNDYKNIEIVEPENLDEWTFDENTRNINQIQWKS